MINTEFWGDANYQEEKKKTFITENRGHPERQKDKENTQYDVIEAIKAKGKKASKKNN